MASFATVTLVTTLLTLGQTDMQSTPEQFQEYGDQFAGRWVADITLIADWPGLSKKQGERVTGHWDTRWLANRHIVEGEGHTLEEISRGIAFWDPASKQIKFLDVNSAGTVAEAILWKADGQWRWKYTAAQRDGKRITGTGGFVFSDGGNTYAIQGTLHMDGKELPKLNDIYKRVGK
jgi:hypothetical protein